MILPTLAAILIVVILILLLVWKLGMQEGKKRRSIYHPDKLEVIIPNLNLFKKLQGEKVKLAGIHTL